MNRVLVLAYLACVLAAAPAHAQSVSSKNGNVCFSPQASADCRQLTNTGLDHDPTLSPDGRLVVFVRDTPGRVVERPTGDEAEQRELWTVRVDGSEARLVLMGGSARGSTGSPVAAFRSPQFSPDGARIYFLSMAAVVTDAVYALDLKTGQLREVCAGNSLIVVQEGKYAGHLVVEQHRYFPGGGSYDWVYVIAPDGKEVGSLGNPNDPTFKDRLTEILGPGDP